MGSLKADRLWEFVTRLVEKDDLEIDIYGFGVFL